MIKMDQTTVANKMFETRRGIRKVVRPRMRQLEADNDPREVKVKTWKKTTNVHLSYSGPRFLECRTAEVHTPATLTLKWNTSDYDADNEF